ncbi:hypothetical protein Tco_0335903 [Tanacetum coccineum]
MENQSDVQNHLVEIQADDHDLLVNSDNENDDRLGYESEKYSDDEDADGTNHAEERWISNHSDLKLVKRGITRLYKFRREYGKPGGIKIKVTFDALNRVSGLHRALFLSFLGDLVREHIGLKILSGEVDKESRDKLWDEITVKLSLAALTPTAALTILPAVEKSARGKMAHSKNVYHYKMGRGGYVFVKEKMIKNKEIEADKEPPRGIIWLKGRVNKDEEFTNDEIRLVGDKLKEDDDKIKEGTLNLDDGTDAMTVVFGKEREVMQEEWEVELHTRVASDMTPMGTYEVAGTQSSVVVRDKDARIQKKSNRLVTSKKEPVKTVGPKKMPKSRRNGSQDSQSQGNVSPTQELPTASKCKLWHLKKSNIVALGTVYKFDGKQMLHNQALLNDCYKVSIDSSLVDTACIPDCMTRSSTNKLYTPYKDPKCKFRSSKKHFKSLSLNELRSPDFNLLSDKEYSEEEEEEAMAETMEQYMSNTRTD